ncbi:MAG: hypothetical protein AAF799_00230 [Myxococcota bacterium]
MTAPSPNAHDRIHLWVNLTLMGGGSALVAWATWTVAVVPIVWRIVVACFAFASAWMVATWLVPRLTGPTIDHWFGQQRSETTGSE